MELRAVKSFRGRLGFIRRGTTFYADANYARQLIKKDLATQVVLEAPRRQAMDEAPRGNSRAGGEEQSPASPPARRSRRRRSTRSEDDPESL